MNEFLVCEMCGAAKTPDQLIERWDGLFVCKDDYEPRHPSTFLRLRSEAPPPSLTSPPPEDVFITVPYVL
jgi:hypothetical protein